MKQREDLEGLSNAALLSRIQESARETKRRLVAEIVMLMEVERRRLHLEMAYSSMYEFCYREMRLSEDQAYRYMNAARLAKKFPEILDDLESGELHLASLALLKKHVRTESDDWLLDVARGKSKREVEKVLATHFPKDDEPRARIQPLSELRSQLEVTLNTTTIEKIQRATELMSHSNPSQAIEVVLDTALDVLIVKLEKAREAKADRPRPANESPEGITRSVRREVSERDGGQCTFVSEAGNRCESKAFLELDHEVPRSRNGPNTPDNIRVMCHAHNQYEARRLLGDECIDRAIESKRALNPNHDPHPNPARAGRMLDALVRMGFKRAHAQRMIDEETRAMRWLGGGGGGC